MTDIALAFGSDDRPGSEAVYGVTDAVRLASGEFVVAQCGTSELRFFDSNGRQLTTVAGRGDGPGEIRGRIANMFLAGNDTLALVDDRFAFYVLHLYTGDGNHVRTVEFPPGLRPLGALSARRFVAERRDSHVTVERARSAGQDTIWTTLFTTDSEGGVLDSLPNLYSAEVMFDDTGAMYPLRFVRVARVAVLPAGVIYGDQLAPRVVMFDEDLQVTREVPAGVKGEAISESDRSRWRAEMESLVPDGSTGFPRYSEVAAPQRPAYGDVIAGRDGGIWVQDPEWFGDYPLVWTRIDMDGSRIRVALPRRFFPFEFSKEWVLGVRFDENNVETLEVRTFAPGEGAPAPVSARDAAIPYTRCGARTAR